MSMQRRLWILACAAAWLCRGSLDRAGAQAVPEALSVQPPPTAAVSSGERQSLASVSVNPHAQNSWYGSSGGARLIDAASGEAGSLRLQLGLEFFRSGNFLSPNDTHRELTGTLALSATLIEQLELFASYTARSNSNDTSNPILLQVAGDLSLGLKSYARLTPWLSAGGDARALLMNTVGDMGVTARATSVGVRAAATADMRYAGAQGIPLIVRANVGYLFDNSGQLIAGVERERYAALPPSSRRALPNEDRQLITRVERFGLGIDRVDLFTVGAGVEAPFEVTRDFFVQPLIEWQLGIPVNRQGYDCLKVPTDATRKSEDGCLGTFGLKAAPSTLTLGARVLPPARGLSVLLACDLGLLGMRRFVRELAPNRPWAAMLAVSYATDMRAPKPERIYVPVASTATRQREVSRLRARGAVVERDSGRPVIGAVVRYPERELSPQLTGAEGGFMSYAFEPGEVVLEITHPDYEPGHCVLQLDDRAANAGSPGAPPSAATTSELFVPAHCELNPRPRSGRLTGTVQDEQARPLAGIAIEIAGPAARSFSSSPTGTFSAIDLPPGEYTARIDSADYLWTTQGFSVTTGNETHLSLTLNAKPKVSQVTLTAHELKIGTQVMFAPNTADIDARSSALLREVADILARNPQIKLIEVEGHTDNRGNSARNRELSQRRAESVVQWLINAGLDPSRFEAKGFGDERPIAPNLTPEARAKNRRVQFVIKQK